LAQSEGQLLFHLVGSLSERTSVIIPTNWRSENGHRSTAKQEDYRAVRSLTQH